MLVLLDVREDDAAPFSWRAKFSTIGRSDRSKMLSASITQTLSRPTKRSGEPERLRDSAGLLLVAVGEPVDPVLVPVAEQPEELAGVRAARDEHQLVDAGPTSASTAYVTIGRS